MAGTLKIGLAVNDVSELSRDLRALGDDLDKPISDVLEQGAQKIADVAKGFMHKGQPSWLTSSAAELYPGGVSAYYDAKGSRLSATVGTTHPGAVVWEYGGEIHPASGSERHAFLRALKGPARAAAMRPGEQVIVIPKDAAVARAGASEQEQLVQNLDDAVSRLVEQYGF